MCTAGTEPSALPAAAASRLIVFVKAPRPGFVKTRIAQALGAETAAAVYRALATRVLANLAGLERVELRFAPDDALTEINPWLRPGWSARPQGAGDLGARLHRAFVEAFATGARHVVVIGSDCPDVQPEDIQRAWHSLATADLALGPARDGGYWLIGLTQAQPRLFAEMPWSTAEVLPQTLGRADALGLRVARLRELADVDSAADGQRFLARTGSAGRRGDGAIADPS